MGLVENKVALVTGGAGEIGTAVAELLVAEGATIMIADRGTEPDGRGADPARGAELARRLAAAGRRAASCDLDVSTAVGAEQTVARTVERFGRIDVLINAAGAAVDGSLTELSDGSFERILSIGVHGAFRCSKHAARRMIEQGGGGRIVNLTSAAGLHGAAGQLSHVTAAAAVYGLTRAAAIDLERQGITVNAVAPVARTRLTRGRPELAGLDPLTADHVAPAVLYFASDCCGRQTGEVLVVGGGRLGRVGVAESRGAFKEGSAPWTAEEIAEHWERLGKLK